MHLFIFVDQILAQLYDFQLMDLPRGLVVRKQNNTCGAVAMTTVLAMVLSKLELKVPVFVLTKYYTFPAI